MPKGLAAILMVLIAMLSWPQPATAIDTVVINGDGETYDILPRVDLRRGTGDELSLYTAPAEDGMVRRLVVRSIRQGMQPDWGVFALWNNTDKRVTRWIVADRQALQGLGPWRGGIHHREMINPPRAAISHRSVSQT